MKPSAFAYVRAKEIEEAISLLASNPDAKLIAGGQSLGPMLNLRLARPGLLIDIASVKTLKMIRDEGNGWRIGSAVTHSQIEDMYFADCEPLANVARGIAYRSIRNRGTVGGSLAHADPAADWPLALATLGATLRIAGMKGMRDVDADKFSTAAFSTVLADDEVVESVYVPKLTASARWGYYKLCRKTGDFPHASAGALVDPARRVSRVFIGSLDKAPSLLPATSRALAANATGVDRELVEKDLSGMSVVTPILARLHGTAVCRAIQQAFPA